MKLKKSNFIKQIAEKNNICIQKARLFVGNFTEAIIENLKEGNVVDIKHLCTFVPKTAKARRCFNFKTNKVMISKEKNTCTIIKKKALRSF